MRNNRGLLFIFIVWNIFLTVLSPFILILIFIGFIINPRFRPGFLGRFGFNPVFSKIKGSVLVHSASLGEFNGVRPFINILLENEKKVSLSAFTDTGYAAIRTFSTRTNFFILPLDGILFLLPLIINRPERIIITETELWPNLIMLSRIAKIPLFLINGRISEKNISSYLWLKPFFRTILRCFTKIFLQDKHSSQLFEQLMKGHSWPVWGSTKIDGMSVPPNQSTKQKELQALLGLQGRKVITAGSVRRAEHEFLISSYLTLLKEPAFSGTNPFPVLILAPRHLDRIPGIKKYLQTTGLEWKLFSEADGHPHKVFLIDKMGLLMDIYSVSDIVFVGGTLVPIGGHNPIEPAAVGCAVIHGHSTSNNSFAFELLKEKNASVEVSPESLGGVLSDLLKNGKALETFKKNARDAVLSARGVSRRIYADLFPPT